MRVLLVDPRSISHGPPPAITKQDRALTEVYSHTLDLIINRKMSNVPAKHNSNAVSNHYISNYGLLMLGTFLKGEGHEVDYINGDYFKDDYEFYSNVVYKAEVCHAICFTATTPQYSSIVSIANVLKELYPKQLLVYGGPHAYFYRNHSESNPFHIICVGHNIIQSGHIILDYCSNNVLPETSLIFDVSGYSDLEKDFSLIPNEFLPETLLYSYISFGCPNNCHYCVEHYFTKRICSLNLDKKLQEINFLIHKANIKVVHLADSDFFINPVIASSFLDLLEKHNLNCCFTVNTSPSVICRKETFSLLQRFVCQGLIEILIGVEYLSETVLSFMNKKYKISDFFSALTTIREFFPELIVSFYSLIGLPGESKATIEENLLWNTRFKESMLYDFSFPKFFVPYPGTDVFERPNQFNIEILHREWEEYHRWSLPRPIRIIGVEESEFVEELKNLYRINEININ